MTRVAIAEFGIPQKGFAFASVTFFLANDDGSNSGVLANVFADESSQTKASNPQTLDSNGMLAVDCYVEAAVVASITGLSGLAARSIKKIRENPVQFLLPVTSSNLYSRITQDSVVWQTKLDVDSPVAMTAPSNYVANGAGLMLFALPVVNPPAGSIIRVGGVGAGGFKITQNAGQKIIFGNDVTTTGAAGYLQSTNANDEVHIRYTPEAGAGTYKVFLALGEITWN